MAHDYRDANRIPLARVGAMKWHTLAKQAEKLAKQKKGGCRILLSSPYSSMH